MNAPIARIHVINCISKHRFKHILNFINLKYKGKSSIYNIIINIYNRIH